MADGQADFVDVAFAYTGRWLDRDTGLQNNLHRWYDAGAGRWTSDDPIGFAAGDANLNRYVGNQPTGHVDPDGLETKQPPWWEEQPWWSIGSWWGVRNLINQGTGYSSSVSTLRDQDREERENARLRAIYDPDFCDPQAFLDTYRLSDAEAETITEYATTGVQANMFVWSGGGLRPGGPAGGGIRPPGGSGRPIDDGLIPMPASGGGFSGRRGYPLTNHPSQPIRNQPTTIYDRPFSGHALDQMQNRGIPPSVVDNCIRHGQPGVLPKNWSMCYESLDGQNGRGDSNDEEA